MSTLGRVWRKLRVALEMIKFEHTIFALPFAYTGAWLASRGVPSAFNLAWVTVAMVGARTAAMALNRLIDWRIDAANPRTATRALPQGLVTPGFVTVFAVAAALVFGVAAWTLGPLCLYLSPVALAVLTGYSYSKRFTWVCHLWLGSALGIAPVGAWIAVRGALHWAPVLVAAGVALWTAGFDIIYACLDIDFDREAGLFSVPARFGLATALGLSRVAYLGAVACWVSVGPLLHLGFPYYCGLAACAALLLYEHRVVSPTDLSRVGLAFATLNGMLSIVFFASVVVSFAVR